jgi:hypothetical protein
VPDASIWASHHAKALTAITVQANRTARWCDRNNSETFDCCRINREVKNRGMTLFSARTAMTFSLRCPSQS